MGGCEIDRSGITKETRKKWRMENQNCFFNAHAWKSERFDTLYLNSVFFSLSLTCRPLLHT